MGGRTLEASLPGGQVRSLRQALSWRRRRRVSCAAEDNAPLLRCRERLSEGAESWCLINRPLKSRSGMTAEVPISLYRGAPTAALRAACALCIRRSWTLPLKASLVTFQLRLGCAPSSFVFVHRLAPALLPKHICFELCSARLDEFLNSSASSARVLSFQGDNLISSLGLPKKVVKGEIGRGWKWMATSHSPSSSPVSRGETGGEAATPRWRFWLLDFSPLRDGSWTLSGVAFIALSSLGWSRSQPALSTRSRSPRSLAQACARPIF